MNRTAARDFPSTTRQKPQKRLKRGRFTDRICTLSRAASPYP
ncbi:hypothetical protein NEISICOT_02829 [Neisseria sicca ATCC 29256]|uniref:Uncharacterized protein n=1 Tax=Neisseria sicca ATCC 29256 TaxID=547045 RepID=C6M8G0_NEISI|nr:hypothetical protein NEISICOT_02829 [Neisseria sicca ATCC 29256]